LLKELSDQAVVCHCYITADTEDWLSCQWLMPLIVTGEWW